jgi:NADH-quinone oxidoreductase subunit G
MATIHIDGKPWKVSDGQNLLEACLSLGFDLPYFCWHPALGSVGACRQCAVKQFKDEHDEKGRIVVACLTGADDGLRLSIDDPEARAFRARVSEWLMVGHPHDCPVCDEGGECHLQDMVVMTGHTYRRYRFQKRTFRNQDLGPFVNHEMNRCIECYRCVRFYRDYAGGRDFDVMASHHYVYFGRHEDGALENEFSGNLVEVCPTGVFTDKTLKRHFTRKWDLETAPSVCVHCGLGCNILPGARYGELRRIRNRFNGEVNGYFLCDRGRYGYDFVNGDRRLRRPLVREGRGEAPRPAAADEALVRVREIVSRGSGVVGIGSPRASLEANFVLRTLVGADRFYAGVSDRERRLVASVIEILRRGPVACASMAEVECSDAGLVLGEDPTATAPRLALALRQLVRQAPLKDTERVHLPLWNDSGVRNLLQDRKGPLYIAAPFATRLDDVATKVHRVAPDDVARLAMAVAHEIDGTLPAVVNLPAEVGALAREIAGALAAAERPLVVAGTASGTESVLRAAASVAWALHAAGRPARLSLTVPECDTLGLGLMEAEGLEAAFELVASGKADTVVVVENDLFRRADPSVVEAFLAAARHVVVLDHVSHETAARAEVVLPAAAFAETDATLVSSEGRAQRSFRVLLPGDEARESWRWLRDLLSSLGREEGTAWRRFDDVTAACARTFPALARITEAAPSADFRIQGEKIPRAPRRESGRTAMSAGVSVHEPKPPQDLDSPFSFSMEGYPAAPPPALLARYRAPGWNSVQALNKFQEEVGGHLRGGDPGVRLIEPSPGERAPFSADAPPAFEPRQGQVLVVPLAHVFGTEEQSALAPAVAERSPRAYLALHPDDRARLGEDALDAELRLGGCVLRLPIVARAELPPGVAGVDPALSDVKGISLPAFATVRRTTRTA